MVKRKLMLYMLSAVVAVSMILPQGAFAITEVKGNNNIDKKAEQSAKSKKLSIKKKDLGTYKDGPDITEMDYSKFASGPSLQGIIFKEIDNHSEYAGAIEGVWVNGKKYFKLGTQPPNNDAYTYETAAVGLRVKTGIVREGANKIKIAAKGFNDKVIDFIVPEIDSKGDMEPKFVMQRNLLPGSSGDTGEQTLDKVPLKTLLDEAAKLKKEGKHLEDWQMLCTAVNYAKVVYDDPVATQDKVEKALLKLSKAVDMFIKSKRVYQKVELPKEKGTYRLGFILNEKGKEHESMAQGFIDRRAKLVISDDNKATISFLNTKSTSTMLDIALKYGGNWHAATKIDKEIKIGKKQKGVEYTFDATGIDLSKKHKLGTLIGVGGQISDKGHYDNKYKQPDLIFTEIGSNWDDYKDVIDADDKRSGEARLQEALIDCGLDKSPKDGKVTADEVKKFAGKKLDLTKYKLTEIGLLSNLPSTVEEIDLSDNEIAKLPADLLKGKSALQNFYIEHNFVTDIPKDFFKDCKNLNWISFSWNRLKSLDNGDLTGLDKLTILDFEGNLIHKIGKDVFKGTPKLNELSFVDNEMNYSHVPNGVFSPLKNSLEKIHFQENYFKKLPTAINDLHSLKFLYAYQNSLTDISNLNFAPMKKLYEADFRNNDITFVKDKAFAKNYDLEALSFEDNQLTNFKTSMVPNRKFRKLNVQMNNMKVVDPALKKRMMYSKAYPQKTSMSFKSVKSSAKSIKWNQKLSILHLMFWHDWTIDYKQKELQSVDEYKAFLEDHDIKEKDFLELLDEFSYDWDIKTRLQKKGKDGYFYTVKETKTSDVDDKMSGSFSVTSKGIYRVTKVLYRGFGGQKGYYCTVMSAPINMDGKSVSGTKKPPTGKKVKVNKVKKLKLKAMLRKVVLRWSKTYKISGYKIYFSTKKKGKFKLLTTVKSSKATKYTIKKSRKIKKNRKYYIKIRAYRKVGKKMYYGKYSNVKSFKIK